MPAGTLIFAGQSPYSTPMRSAETLPLPWLIMVQTEPVYDFVHTDSRYQSLVKKIGLPFDRF